MFKIKHAPGIVVHFVSISLLQRDITVWSSWRRLPVRLLSIVLERTALLLLWCLASLQLCVSCLVTWWLHQWASLELFCETNSAISVMACLLCFCTLSKTCFDLWNIFLIFVFRIWWSNLKNKIRLSGNWRSNWKCLPKRLVN